MECERFEFGVLDPRWLLVFNAALGGGSTDINGRLERAAEQGARRIAPALRHPRMYSQNQK